jgi:hypothetical protein
LKSRNGSAPAGKTEQGRAESINGGKSDAKHRKGFSKKRLETREIRDMPPTERQRAPGSGAVNLNAQLVKLVERQSRGETVKRLAGGAGVTDMTPEQMRKEPAEDYGGGLKRRHEKASKRAPVVLDLDQEELFGVHRTNAQNVPKQTWAFMSDSEGMWN